MSVFVFLFPVLGLKLQGELSALPSLSSGQFLARHDQTFRDEDVLCPLFRRDFLLDGEELVGERSRVEVSFGNFKIDVALRLFVLQDVAESSIQPVVAVSLDESAPTETKPEVVKLDVRCRLFRPDEVEQ